MFSQNSFKIGILIALGLSTLSSTASSTFNPVRARTWTSTKGKVFQGDFVCATKTQVFLKSAKNRRILGVSLSYLSSDDQAYIKTKATESPKIARIATPIREYDQLMTGQWQLSHYRDLPFAFYGAKTLDPAKKYPLVICLHGIKKDRSNGAQIAFAQQFAEKENYRKRPCLILAPSGSGFPGDDTNGADNNHEGIVWANPAGELTFSLIETLIQEIPLIDSKRIYIVGQSTNRKNPSSSSWQLVGHKSRRFAAALDISVSLKDPSKLISLPKFVFCRELSQNDSSTLEIPSKKKAKLSKKFRMFDFSQLSPHPMGTTVDNEAVHSWLFEQHRYRSLKKF